MHSEWRYRYDHPSTKIHKSYEMMKSLPIPDYQDIGLTPFVACMDEQYKTNDIVESYRNFYNYEKVKFCRWNKKRKAPFWFIGKEHESNGKL